MTDALVAVSGRGAFAIGRTIFAILAARRFAGAVAARIGGFADFAWVAKLAGFTGAIGSTSSAIFAVMGFTASVSARILAERIDGAVSFGASGVAGGCVFDAGVLRLLMRQFGCRFGRGFRR